MTKITYPDFKYEHVAHRHVYGATEYIIYTECKLPPVNHLICILTNLKIIEGKDSPPYCGHLGGRVDKCGINLYKVTVYND